MFERFTQQARNVVVGAQAEARQLRHRHIGTEHLLLALVADDAGIACAVLRDAGVHPGGVRADIDAFVGQKPDVLGTDDAAALRAIGIDLDAVRSKIEESFGEGALEPVHVCQSRRRGLFRARTSGGGVVRGHIPFTPRAKKVLQLSLREALRLHHNYIGPEHILLGLLREGEGLAAKVLTDAGVSLDDLRHHVMDALNRAA